MNEEIKTVCMCMQKTVIVCVFDMGALSLYFRFQINEDNIVGNHILNVDALELLIHKGSVHVCLSVLQIDGLCT